MEWVPWTSQFLYLVDELIACLTSIDPAMDCTALQLERESLITHRSELGCVCFSYAIYNGCVLYSKETSSDWVPYGTSINAVHKSIQISTTLLSGDVEYRSLQTPISTLAGGAVFVVLSIRPRLITSEYRNSNNDRQTVRQTLESQESFSHYIVRRAEIYWPNILCKSIAEISKSNYFSSVHSTGFERKQSKIAKTDKTCQ